jgi:hypothetical protein
MGMAKPTGGYAQHMVDPGGWPEIDEDAFYHRAQHYTRALRQVTEVLQTCQHQQSEIFEGGIWLGSAAGAANRELATNIGELLTLQHGMATVISWQKYVAESIARAKSVISDNVQTAHKQIITIATDSSLDAAERSTAINNVLVAAYGANVSVVAGTAEQILASKSWKPSSTALKDLPDQKTPPAVTPSDTSPPVPPPPSAQERLRLSPGQPGPMTHAPVVPERPPQSSPGRPALGGVLQPTPGTPPLPGQPPVLRTPAPGGPNSTAPGAAPVGGPAAPGSPAAPVRPTAPGSPAAGVRPAALGNPAAPGSPAATVRPAALGSPAAPGSQAAPGSPAAGLGPAARAVLPSPSASAQPRGAEARGKGRTPASAASPPLGVHPEDSSPPVAPAEATGVPGAPTAPDATSGASGGSGAGSRAPVGAKPSSAQPTTRSAAADRSAARSGAAAHSKSADNTEPPDVVVSPAIPVSAAQAERDAIAAATGPGGVNDPLQLARRIAAALNAPSRGAGGGMGFFWVTAVTTDGEIVVANSYGLAYIPDRLQLPENVHMASADESIANTERARWATYPVMAVQGWAAQHNTELRAVIGTAEQLANSDAGVARVVLEPDDIPDTGDMIGRSRLEVVDPDAAGRLAATTDARLIRLLPPAPADAGSSADQRLRSEQAKEPEMPALVALSVAAGTTSRGQLLADPPAAPADASPPTDDQRLTLWIDVMRPLASSSDGRRAAHLRAFHTYAAHTEEVVLKEAHTAVDPVAQRSAVADWLYWKHLNRLVGAALADAS